MSCTHCKYKSRLWGVWYCLLDKWHGINNEKMCAEFTRANPMNHAREASCK